MNKLYSVFGAGVLVFGCADHDVTSLDGALSTMAAGSVELAITASDGVPVTVTLSRTGAAFTPVTQTATTRDGGRASVSFGALPAGGGYLAELSAGECSGSSSFDVSAGATTRVSVTLDCAPSSADAGGAVIETQLPLPHCDLIAGISASPGVVVANYGGTTITLQLREGVPPMPMDYVHQQLALDRTDKRLTSIRWHSEGGNISRTNGDYHTLPSNPVDFNCGSLEGPQLVTATVIVDQGQGDCSDSASVTVECLNQARCADFDTTECCGNGRIEPGEECDGNDGAQLDAMPSCGEGRSGFVLCGADCRYDDSQCSPSAAAAPR
ncbi:MAG TPA: hypothetical protein VFS67_26250 [Polyangiaceae bacterium]|nr:hypothetical protein [Polyangiaceae bacterium]